MFRAPCAHHQGVKIVLYSIWCHHTLEVAVRCTVLSQLLLVGRVYCCSCLVYCCSCLVCIFVGVLYCYSCLVSIVVMFCVSALLYVYCCFYFRSRTAGYKSVFGSFCERPPRHRFSWFPCVYKQMLRWFPTFQVATTCFSCSPPNLNLLVTNFKICIHVK